jgi:hypothetical protein
VANNLNDISKDHPALVTDLTTRWLRDAPPERRRLVSYALRTLLKAGDPAALAAIGLDGRDSIALRALRAEPAPARIGEVLRVSLEVVNESAAPARALVHLRVHFVTARGGTSRRVFVVRDLTLEPGARVPLAKIISLRQHTTRTHHPGEHRIEAVVNGTPVAETEVLVLPAGEHG